jgi:hypothetical protein
VKQNDQVFIGFGGPGRIAVEIASNSKPSYILQSDFTANALNAFLYLKEKGSIRFERFIEGQLTITETYNLT